MNPSNLFVYGILKRGFQLDLTERGAKFLGEAQLPGAVLYRIGHGGVGLRLEKDPNRVAYGEVFEIPEYEHVAHLAHIYEVQGSWSWLDSIESNGLAYTRKVVTARYVDADGYAKDHPGVECWCYEHTFPGARYDRPIESGKYEFLRDY